MAAITTRITSGTGATVKNAPLSSTEIDNNFINLNTELVLKSTIASPTFTGVPAAPTATIDTNTTQLATTAFVIGQGYLKSSVAATTYLTTATAGALYLTIADPTSTGTFGHTGTLNVTGDINATGDITTAYSSDRNLKTNIETIKDALQKVKQLSGYTFNWNELSGKPTTRKEAGVLAQEVELALPESVTTKENGYKAVYYDQLSALLIEAIKELSVKVETLESKINGI
jgi:hypothetical protein